MNIDLKKKNKELSVITLEISSQDYNEKVESILNDYKKKKLMFLGLERVLFH